MMMVSPLLTTLHGSAGLDEEYVGVLVEDEAAFASYPLLRCSPLVLDLVKMSIAVVMHAVISAAPCPACPPLALMVYPLP